MQSLYNKGDTVDIGAKNQIRNSITGLYTDRNADTGYPTITITDSAGTVKVNAAVMPQITTATYLYSYQLATNAAAGNWTVKLVTTDGGYTNIEYKSFRVI